MVPENATSPQLFLMAESMQKNSDLGGLADVDGVIYVGTYQEPKQQTLLDYLKSYGEQEEPELMTPVPPPDAALVGKTSMVSSSTNNGDSDSITEVTKNSRFELQFGDKIYSIG